MVHLLALGGSGRGLLRRPPGLGGFLVIVESGIGFRERLPVSGVSAIEFNRYFEQLDSLLGVRLALRQEEAWLGLLGLELDGLLQRLFIAAICASLFEQRLIFAQEFLIAQDTSELVLHQELLGKYQIGRAHV